MHALVLPLVLFAGEALADEADDAPRAPSKPRETLYLRNLTVARLNPLGLLNLAQASYRLRLYDSDSVAFSDNFIGVGIAPALSPAFVRVGPVLEVQPASFLQLWASFELLGYFGTFGYMQSFPSATSEYSDTRLDALDALPDGDAGRPYAAEGTQLNLGATLQAKVGPLAVRNFFRLMRPDYHARAGDAVVYDILFDVLAPNRGWYLNDDLDLLWVTDFGLTAGVRYTVTTAFYEDRHFAAGELATNPNTPMHRVGPLVAYSLWKDRGGAFDNPTLLLVANWWLSHRYRTGEDSSQAMPYLVLGFQFTGDLTPRQW